MVVTKHGEKRARERAGAKKRTAKKMAQAAFDKGIKHSETSGSLKRYMDSLYLKEHRANNLRIWSEKVWIFYDDRLVTVLPLPTRYKNTVKKIFEGERE